MNDDDAGKRLRNQLVSSLDFAIGYEMGYADTPLDINNRSTRIAIYNGVFRTLNERGYLNEAGILAMKDLK